MNTQPNTPKTVITLDRICQLKAEKLAEIRASKQRITQQAHDLFHPTDIVQDIFRVGHPTLCIHFR